jgi:hypothetical protein
VIPGRVDDGKVELEWHLPDNCVGDQLLDSVHASTERKGTRGRSLGRGLYRVASHEAHVALAGHKQEHSPRSEKCITARLRRFVTPPGLQKRARVHGQTVRGVGVLEDADTR